MKLALVFMLVFVTMSHQQQFQKQFYWMGENSNQKDQTSRIYNQPIIIRNNFIPHAEGQLQGLPQQGIILDGYDGERSFDAINPSLVVSSVGEQYNPPYLYRSSPAQTPYLFLDYINGYKGLNDNEAYFRQSPGAQDYVVNQDSVSRGSYRPAPAIYPPSQQRLFFNALGFSLVPINNSNNVNNGLFGLNPTVIITSTVNTTTVTTCVSATEFSAGSGVTNCRRRRHDMEQLLAFDDLVGSPSLSPSAVEEIEPTLTSEDYVERNAKLHELLATSKDDLVIESDNTDRDKRQIFRLFSTRTLTSYVIYTLSSTKTVKLAAGGTSSALNCKPSGFVICTGP